VLSPPLATGVLVGQPAAISRTNGKFDVAAGAIGPKRMWHYSDDGYNQSWDLPGDEDQQANAKVLLDDNQPILDLLVENQPSLVALGDFRWVLTAIGRNGSGKAMLNTWESLDGVVASAGAYPAYKAWVPLGAVTDVPGPNSVTLHRPYAIAGAAW
jgi:hypothetical protein